MRARCRDDERSLGELLAADIAEVDGVVVEALEEIGDVRVDGLTRQLSRQDADGLCQRTRRMDLDRLDDSGCLRQYPGRRLPSATATTVSPPSPVVR
jgi:hypothetical protein